MQSVNTSGMYMSKDQIEKDLDSIYKYGDSVYSVLGGDAPNELASHIAELSMRAYSEGELLDNLHLDIDPTGLLESYREGVSFGELDLYLESFDSNLLSANYIGAAMHYIPGRDVTQEDISSSSWMLSKVKISYEVYELFDSVEMLFYINVYVSPSVAPHIYIPLPLIFMSDELADLVGPFLSDETLSFDIESITDLLEILSDSGVELIDQDGNAFLLSVPKAKSARK